MTERMYRSRDERMIAGVSGGLADRFDLDPALIRIGWVVLGLVTYGFAVLLYILMAIVVPHEPDEPGVAGDDPGAAAARRAEREARRAARRERQARRGGTGSAGVVFGAVLILVGVYFLVSQYVPWLDVGRMWPVLLIGLGVLLLVNSLSSDSRHSD